MTTRAHLQGWYEQNTEGLGTVYFAITDEGLLTRVTDTPSAIAFPPRIRNPDTFSIRRVATFWPWGDTTESMAAVGDLEIDNYDGAYDFLLTADLRDAPAVFKIVPAGMYSAANTVANGIVVATVLIDDISCSTEDVIRIQFKDTMARLDAPLPVRYNPPFVDTNAANRMVPLSFGACRNVAPQLIYEDGIDGSGEPVYRLHDSMLANIAQVRDMGAVLDVNADPPQVIPALNRSGIQLHTAPAGKLLCDISNTGTQAIAPGATDVLNGTGLLTTWPVSGSPPTGWTYGGTGTNSRVGTPNYPQDYCMNMSTQHQYTSVDDALYAYVTTPFLLPGQTYRIKFTLDRMTAPTGTVLTGGFMVRTDLGTNNDGAVSGQYFGPYLTAPIFGSQQYTFEYTVPNDGTTRTLYMIMVGTGVSNPAWTCAWHGLTVELLGGFEEAPLSSITLEDYWNEILYLRAYEDTTLWDATSLQAIDAATGYGFGIHFDSAPNILRDCLLGPLPSYCASAATNADGQLYAFRMVDPKTETAVAGFDLTNTQRPIAIRPDRAPYLTTVMGVRHNWTVSTPADFVSVSNVEVTPDIRARYSRASQYQVTSSKTPAGQYAHAIGAPVFDSLLDGPDDNPQQWGQEEIDRVVGFYSPTVYDDGTIFNGKRQFVDFTVFFDDVGALGDQTFGALTAPGLLLGMTVELTYSHSNGVAMFSNTPVLICGTELFPFGNKITITGWY